MITVKIVLFKEKKKNLEGDREGNERKCWLHYPGIFTPSLSTLSKFLMNGHKRWAVITPPTPAGSWNRLEKAGIAESPCLCPFLFKSNFIPEPELRKTNMGPRGWSCPSQTPPSLLHLKDSSPCPCFFFFSVPPCIFCMVLPPRDSFALWKGNRRREKTVAVFSIDFSPSLWVTEANI